MWYSFSISCLDLCFSKLTQKSTLIKVKHKVELVVSPKYFTTQVKPPIPNRWIGAVQEIRLKMKECVESKLWEEWKDTFDDNFLYRILQAKQMSIPKSLYYVRNYIQYRDYYRTELIDAKFTYDNHKFLTTATLECRNVNVLKYRDKDDSVIVLIRVENWDEKTLRAEDALQEYVALAELGFRHESSTSGFGGCGGGVIILDCNHLKWTQIASLRPQMVKKLYCLLLKSLPLKLKSFHVVNCGRLAHTTYNLIRPLMSTKVVGKIHIHSSRWDDLHKCIPKEILPVTLGGELQESEAYEERIVCVIRQAIINYQNGILITPIPIN